MKRDNIKYLLIFGIFAFIFIYFSYDRVSSSDTIKIQNLEVKTADLGYVRLINDNIDYNINFNKVGEEFIFSFDLTNDTKFDMCLNKINITGLGNWLSYRIYDINGNNISDKEIIKKNSMKKVFVLLKYEHVNIENNIAKMAFNIKVTKV